MTPSARSVVELPPDGAGPLVQQITEHVRALVDDRTLRAGARLPSIRAFAEASRVSKFTVVEAYDRLVAQGYLESRRGSGFYVRSRPAPRPEAGPAPGVKRIDIVWLLEQIYSSGDDPRVLLAANGLLPAGWLDQSMIGASIRALARQPPSQLTGYGSARGYAPLRELLQVHLAALEIQAQAEQIVLTSGATQALDLVARTFLKAGDNVLVDDPGYYVLHGQLAAMGVNLIGVPRTQQGPDTARMEVLAREFRPRIFFTNSVLHNPTGTCIGASVAHRVLRIAEEHDFFVCEDDVFGDLHPGPTHRIAELDQLRRVVYVGGFSKTLGAGLRVGFVAAEREIAKELTHQKMLASLATPEMVERLVHRILSDGHYRKHVEQVRNRLARHLEPAMRNLEKAGLELFHPATAGMFLWARTPTHEDAEHLVRQAHASGIVLAPGILFSAARKPSPWMRFHTVAAANPRLVRFFDSVGR